MEGCRPTITLPASLERGNVETSESKLHMYFFLSADYAVLPDP